MLTQLTLSGNGYGFETPEFTQVQERLAFLGQHDSDLDPSHTPDAFEFEKKRTLGFSRAMQAYGLIGLLSYKPLTPAALLESYTAFVEATKAYDESVLVAPDMTAWRHHLFRFITTYLFESRMHMMPEFDKEVFVGKDCSRLRSGMESYDFDLLHAEYKSSRISSDYYLFGHCEAGVLLWCGDLEAAKAGWQKQIEARKKITALVQKGERAWSEYLFEELMVGPATLIGGMLAAGQMDMVRELIPHMFISIALRDPDVAAEMEKTLCNTQHVSWQGPDGYCYWRLETLTLQARALAAVVDDSEIDVESLRVWLPRPDELIYITEHECQFCSTLSGASHPAILCATLYGTRLNAWDDAEAIVNGVLAIPPLGDGKGFGMQPLVRIEAWRLLARCRGECGKAAGACEALEHAASESRGVGYVWMEAESLRDMLPWVEGTAEEASARMRIAAVESSFLKNT